MNKLVRDFIPRIIENRGEKAFVYVAKRSEYKRRLIDKLLEEVFEFQENPCIEELADILEVIDALHQAFDFSKKRVCEVQKCKRLERGGFANRYVLKKVEKEANLP